MNDSYYKYIDRTLSDYLLGRVCRVTKSTLIGYEQEIATSTDVATTKLNHIYLEKNDIVVVIKLETAHIVNNNNNLYFNIWCLYNGKIIKIPGINADSLLDMNYGNLLLPLT